MGTDQDMTSPSGSLTVGILLFPEVEVLDFAGPYEVFSVAGRIGPKALKLDAPPFRTVTVAQSRHPVTARHGLGVVPDYDFETVPQLDVLIVPGGVVTEPMSNPATLEWLARTVGQARLTASVCTGAFVLAKLGLLDGLKATTHWEDLDDLRGQYPDIEVVEDVAFVDEGGIVTSAGISAGINMSLYLVGRLVSPDLAGLTARQMQYDWTPQPG